MPLVALSAVYLPECSTQTRIYPRALDILSIRALSWKFILFYPIEERAVVLLGPSAHP